MKRICLLVLLFSAMFLNGPAVAEILFNDNFDSYTTGSVPGDAWIVSQSGGDVLVSDTGFSGKSVRVQRTDFAGGGITVNFGHTHSQASDRVTYEAYFNSSTVDRETLVINGYSSGGGNTGPWVSVGAISGQLASYDGSWHSITPILANTWYHIRIIAYISSNTFDVYVDDMNTPKQTGLNFRDSGVTNLDSLWFQVFNAFNPPINGDLAYVDNVSAFTTQVSGTITYTGAGTGQISVAAFDGSDCGIGAYQEVLIPGPGPYTLNLNPGTYHICACRDTNGNGTCPDSGEPANSYSLNPVVVAAGATVTGINISIEGQQLPVAESVPTMTEWGMIMLTVLLGIGSIYNLRRRRSAS